MSASWESGDNIWKAESFGLKFKLKDFSKPSESTALASK